MTDSMMKPIVVFSRGNFPESTHYGSVCIVKDNGERVFDFGDSSSPVFLRSTLKPFQALALFSSSAVKKFGLNREAIAIGCASHIGGSVHRGVVQKILDLIGEKKEMLQCGVHWPIDREAVKELYFANKKPDSLFHNCSGKHVCFLATTKALGEDLGSYLDPESLTQKEIRKIIEKFTDNTNLQLGIDGCSAPNYATSLYSGALALSRFATGSIPEYREGCSEIITSLAENPELLRGKDHFDSIITKRLGGVGFSKIGAEGVIALSLRVNGEGFGILIKISDGDPSHRAGFAVAVNLLDRFKLMEDLGDLKLKFGERNILNAASKVTGEIKVLC